MDFYQSLYREHLEEISMLYDQKLDLIRSCQMPWNEFIHLEKRLDSHIDALVTGGQRALIICEEVTIDGDVGERYGALRVLCRQKRCQALNEFIPTMDLKDNENAKAIGDAFCQDLPESCEIELIHGLLKMSPDHLRLATRIITFRRLDFAGDLIGALQRYSDDRELTLDLLHALGRLRPRQGAEFLLNFLHSTDDVLVNAAMTTLVRIGERHALKECMAFIGPGDWPKRSLGLYGDNNALTDSFFTVSNLDEDTCPSLTRDLVIAAGLIGNVEVIPDMIDWLTIPDLSETTALFLNLITGAEIYEEVRVPDPVDTDELFDDERHLWEKGLLYPSGKEPATQVRRLSRNPEDWAGWWKKKQGHFDPAIRYRNGKPYSHRCLIDNLKSPDSPDLIRRLAYEELVIRYGIDIPFETDMSVCQQLSAIETYMIRLKGNPDGFVDGLWYYNGKPMTKDILNSGDTLPNYGRYNLNL